MTGKFDNKPKILRALVRKDGKCSQTCFACGWSSAYNMRTCSMGWMNASFRPSKQCPAFGGHVVEIRPPREKEKK